MKTLALANVELESRGVELVPAEAIETDDFLVSTANGKVATLSLVIGVYANVDGELLVDVLVDFGNGPRHIDFEGDDLVVRVRRETR